MTVDREEEPLDTVSSGEVLNETLDRVGWGLSTITEENDCYYLLSCINMQ